MPPSELGQFIRVKQRNTPSVPFVLNGQTVEARTGDMLLTAILLHRTRLRTDDTTNSGRAGFCLMGGCQECWVRLADGRRLRACTTLVTEGMHILTGDHDRV
jgi:aerobic-type carbon monoxide dehydrogenase small subunit (CoxS/CutS family)